MSLRDALRLLLPTAPASRLRRSARVAGTIQGVDGHAAADPTSIRSSGLFVSESLPLELAPITSLSIACSPTRCNGGEPSVNCSCAIFRTFPVATNVSSNAANN